MKKGNIILYLLFGALALSYVRAFMVARKLGYDLNWDGWVYSLTHLDLYNENFERALSGMEKVDNPKVITTSEDGTLYYEDGTSLMGGGGATATPYEPEATTPVVNVNISTDQEDETPTNDEVEGTDAPIAYIEERRPEGVYEVGTGETGRTAGTTSSIVTTSEPPETRTPTTTTATTSRTPATTPTTTAVISGTESPATTRTPVVSTSTTTRTPTTPTVKDKTGATYTAGTSNTKISKSI